jgi:hypothetical protein
MKPVVTLTIDGRVIRADCPICHDPLPMVGEVGSVQEQEQKMQTAFYWHMRRKHPHLR